MNASDSDPAAGNPHGELRRRHLRFGWWSLLVFAAAGIALETLHGFKVAWFLDAGQETRRMLWRLAHAHGTLLALVHLAFAVSLPSLAATPRLASPALIGASIALPLGFFLGGLTPHGGDPGIGILLVPIGAVLLLLAIVQTARSV